jgi:transposase
MDVGADYAHPMHHPKSLPASFFWGSGNPAQIGQVIKFCGLAPGRHQSGSSVQTNRGVSKQSTVKLRAVLYCGARSAIRYNKACKDLYERLRAKGKLYYKAMVAVMAKMLKQVFAVVKSGVPFDNEVIKTFFNVSFG